jgi:hypothetical protein
MSDRLAKHNESVGPATIARAVSANPTEHESTKAPPTVEVRVPPPTIITPNQNPVPPPQAPKESKNSLRRRIFRLADEITALYLERQKDAPQFPPQGAVTDEEPQKANQAFLRYNEQTNALCMAKFRDPLVGVVQEIKAKGLNTQLYGYSVDLEVLVRERCIGGAELDYFRSLAYRFD